MKLPQLKRCYIIVEMLNDMKIHSHKEIREKVNDKMGQIYCKSQIEKDLSWIKWNLDLDDYYSSGQGIRLYEPLDFWKALKNYLDI
jgi:hypothetical protein